MNQNTYDNLSAEKKQALDKTAAEFENRRWATAEADQKANEQKLVDYGAKIVEFSNTDIAITAKKIQKVVWPEILNDVGKEWGQGVLDRLVK